MTPPSPPPTPTISPPLPWSSVWFWVAIGLAGVVRSISLVQYLASPLAGLYRADHAFYREWAKRIAAGHWSNDHAFEQGPLYAYLAGAFYALCGEWDLGGIALQLAAGVVTVAVVYRIGQKAFDESTARVAAMVTAVYGPLISYECMVMKTFLTSLLCTLLALVLLKAYETSRLRWSALAATLVGGLCLIGENYVLLLPVVLVVAARGRATWRAAVGAMLIPIGCVILVTSPATIHNWRVSGERIWITSGGGEVLYMAWAPEAMGYYRPAPFVRPDPVFEHEDFRLESARQLGHRVSYRESSQYWTSRAAREILQSPSRATGLVFRKLAIAVNDFEVPDSEFYEVTRERIPILSVLPTFGWVAGWGLLGLIWLPPGKRREQWLIASVVVVHLVSIAITYNFARFRLGMAPVVILFASSAVSRLIRRLREPQDHSQVWSLAGLAGGSLLCLVTFLPPPGFAEAGYPEMADQFRVFLDARQRLLAEARELRARPDIELSSANRQRLAELYFAAQETDAAVEVLESIVQNDPAQITAQMQLAILLGQRGNYPESEERLLRALRVAPTDADLWANLGNVRFHRALQGTLGEENRDMWLRRAEAAYSEGLRLSPGHPTCEAGRRGVAQSLGPGDAD
jgi:4-amino-4-deoxy-L-arabinose transferase-like glycosyltransferase